MKREVHGLEVDFVAQKGDFDFVMGVVLYFVEPLVQVIEGGPAGHVEDQEGCDGSLVVGPSYGFEGLLSCLVRTNITVSQIWVLMVSCCSYTIFEANSTPRVGSCSFLKWSWVYLRMRQDLPTPKG